MWHLVRVLSLWSFQFAVHEVCYWSHLTVHTFADEMLKKHEVIVLILLTCFVLIRHEKLVSISHVCKFIFVCLSSSFLCDIDTILMYFQFIVHL